MNYDLMKTRLKYHQVPGRRGSFELIFGISTLVHH